VAHRTSRVGYKGLVERAPSSTYSSTTELWPATEPWPPVKRSVANSLLGSRDLDALIERHA